MHFAPTFKTNKKDPREYRVTKVRVIDGGEITYDSRDWIINAMGWDAVPDFEWFLPIVGKGKWYLSSDKIYNPQKHTVERVEKQIAAQNNP